MASSSLLPPSLADSALRRRSLEDLNHGPFRSCQGILPRRRAHSRASPRSSPPPYPRAQVALPRRLHKVRLPTPLELHLPLSPSSHHLPSRPPPSPPPNPSSLPSPLRVPGLTAPLLPLRLPLMACHPPLQDRLLAPPIAPTTTLTRTLRSSQLAPTLTRCTSASPRSPSPLRPPPPPDLAFPPSPS
ncbi:uncharacterized protein A4U43_C01F32270 [Asparagus officinalis]|uniref:Uncharacterized protein n=1 Tax=Asparagus officinalis TaxID=4686 RepID=A0A5P1FW00_ASPOF|nr:uncharacterized protein A4U43_C01F32270 [Asparagus officinalis]